MSRRQDIVTSGFATSYWGDVPQARLFVGQAAPRALLAVVVRRAALHALLAAVLVCVSATAGVGMCIHTSNKQTRH